MGGGGSGLGCGELGQKLQASASDSVVGCSADVASGLQTLNLHGV